MADQGLTSSRFPSLRAIVATTRASAIAIAALAIAGCAETPSRVEAPNAAAQPSEPALPFPEAESAWGRLHSLRFHLSVPVPDRAMWREDDRSRAELLAAQASTRSKLVVLVEPQPALVNRQRCEARARELGLVPTATLRTVEDAITVGPEAYDTRVWVAVETSKTESGPIVGHVLAFGAYVRKCLFVHVTSEIASGRDESVLSQRLALARVRMVGGITMDNFQEVPRESHDPRDQRDLRDPRENAGPDRR
jgi:hypothetical protein